MINLRDVTKTFHAGGGLVSALRGVSLDVAEGEFVAILGPSGSGKSTLLHLVGGLDRPTTGAVFVSGSDLSVLSRRALAGYRNRDVGFVFQAFHLLAHLTVAENVRLPLVYSCSRTPRSPSWVPQVLAAVGMADKTHRRPAELSGGEQQRVAIARALVCDPRIVLADEPTGNLDSQTGEQIFRLLELLHEAGKTVIVVTHEEPLARRADRVVRLRDGVLV